MNQSHWFIHWIMYNLLSSSVFPLHARVTDDSRQFQASTLQEFIYPRYFTLACHLLRILFTFYFLHAFLFTPVTIKPLWFHPVRSVGGSIGKRRLGCQFITSRGHNSHIRWSVSNVMSHESDDEPRWLCAYVSRNVLHPGVDGCEFNSACRRQTMAKINMNLLLLIY